MRGRRKNEENVISFHFIEYNFYTFYFYLIFRLVQCWKATRENCFCIIYGRENEEKNRNRTHNDNLLSAFVFSFLSPVEAEQKNYSFSIFRCALNESKDKFFISIDLIDEWWRAMLFFCRSRVLRRWFTVSFSRFLFLSFFDHVEASIARHYLDFSSWQFKRKQSLT